jgi:hypothetical protein
MRKLLVNFFSIGNNLQYKILCLCPRGTISVLIVIPFKKLSDIYEKSTKQAHMDESRKENVGRV